MLLEPTVVTGAFDPRISARGVCPECAKEHGMVVGYAAVYAKKLINKLIAKKRIDLDVPDSQADPRFSTDYLFGEARGQMFGVLVVRDRQGKNGVLKAFSGQYNGAWEVDGWVPPLIDVATFTAATSGIERLIKKLTRQINELPKESVKRELLEEKRRAISHALQKDIHAMYKVPNFKGELKSLPDVVGDRGIPTGTGDCCAPKLLAYAALNGLKPLGLAEFYFGRENKSGSKRHGAMYTSCRDKCGRILGYMLCGQGKRLG